MLASVEDVKKQKAAFTLLLPGATGILVHAKGSDDKLVLRLERNKAYWALKNGILDEGEHAQCLLYCSGCCSTQAASMPAMLALSAQS